MVSVPLDDDHRCLAAEQSRDALLQVAQRVPMLREDHQLLMRKGRRPRDLGAAQPGAERQRHARGVAPVAALGGSPAACSPPAEPSAAITIRRLRPAARGAGGLPAQLVDDVLDGC